MVKMQSELCRQSSCITDIQAAVATTERKSKALTTQVQQNSAAQDLLKRLSGDHVMGQNVELESSSYPTAIWAVMCKICSSFHLFGCKSNFIAMLVLHKTAIAKGYCTAMHHASCAVA